MLCHLLQHLVSYCGDIRTRLCTVDHVDRVADAGGDDPGVDIMHLENLSELADQVDTGHGDVVQTAWERGNIGGSRAGGKQGLGGGVTTNPSLKDGRAVPGRRRPSLLCQASHFLNLSLSQVQNIAVVHGRAGILDQNHLGVLAGDGVVP